MAATALKSDGKVRFRASRKLRLLCIVMLAVVVALLVERWRGQRALHAWQQATAVRGDVLDLAALWPKPDEQSRQFSSLLSNVTRRLPAELTAMCGLMSGIVPDKPGCARRGSQEPRPRVGDAGNNTNTWLQVESAVSKGAAEVEQLRRLMGQVPASTGDDILERMRRDGFVNFVGSRIGAQTLHTVVIHDLHRGNLEGALENLVALSAFVQLHADEPTLVNSMIRVAILSVSEDVYWDALQAPGWTEDQLARLQQAAQIQPVLSQLPHVLQAERAQRLYRCESFRAQSHEAWLDRHEDMCKSFGIRLPAWKTAPPFRQWQQWVFHPLWGFAWADQEELCYLEHTQLELDALRDGVKQGSWRHLSESLNAIGQGYRPPPARWRFHGRLPPYDDLSKVIGSSPSPEPACPYPDLSRAWLATFKRLTRHQLVTTAIALKRHELRHGQPPATLKALVPDFLPAAPRDLMDGQPLRYRLNRDGSFVLYSVGEDMRDDGGDSVSDTPLGESRDWVWPRLASGACQPGG